MYDKYKDRADFYWIYIREAHPTDGPRPNKRVKIKQPTSFDERLGVASSCAGDIKLTLPLLVDDMENSVAKAYNAMPDRLFIVTAEGKIGYRGARGPKGFKVPEMETALQEMLEPAPKAD